MTRRSIPPIHLRALAATLMGAPAIACDGASLRVCPLPGGPVRSAERLGAALDLLDADGTLSPPSEVSR